VRPRFFTHHLLIACFTLSCLMSIGCDSSEGYRVSGTVTFMGSPVPAGKVYFMPDGTKGNTGATGFADIRDGHFDTSLVGGQPAPAGPVIIALEGVDPNAAPDSRDASGEVTAKLLFARYELPAEIPKAASTKDIDVPAEAAKGPIAPKVKNTIVP
jgi:hypothetical protein